MDESELILYTFVCVQISRLMTKYPDSWHRVLFMLTCVVLIIKKMINISKSENETQYQAEEPPK